jgi:hypothetical protein
VFPFRAVGSVALLASLVGCGPSAVGPIHPAGTPTAVGIAPGLVEQSSNGAAFLQVIQVGQALSGTWTFYQYSPTAAGHVSQGTDTVTGLVQGAAIQLTFDGATTDLGTLSPDGSITLQFPQTDGTLAPVTLTPGTSADYNGDLLPIQALVNQWSNTNWATVAAKACILTDGTHDVRVFVESGGSSVCSAAERLGYTVITTYVPGDTVLCVGSSSMVTVAVADDGGQILGDEICPEVNAGTFPSGQAPTY